MRRLIPAIVFIVLFAQMPAALSAVAQDEGADPCDTVVDHDLAQMLLDTNSTGDFVDDYDPDGNGIACDHNGYLTLTDRRC